MKKPAKPRRDAVVYVRLTEKERDAVAAAAARDQRGVGDWARLALVEAASRSQK